MWLWLLITSVLSDLKCPFNIHILWSMYLFAKIIILCYYYYYFKMHKLGVVPVGLGANRTRTSPWTWAEEQHLLAAASSRSVPGPRSLLWLPPTSPPTTTTSSTRFRRHHRHDLSSRTDMTTPRCGHRTSLSFTRLNVLTRTRFTPLIIWLSLEPGRRPEEEQSEPTAHTVT